VALSVVKPIAEFSLLAFSYTESRREAQRAAETMTRQDIKQTIISSMDFMLNIDIKKLPDPVTYQDKILLIGSCFTEHIGNTLAELKFHILQNPNGILFDPASVCKSLTSYIENKKYGEEDLFQLNEYGTVGNIIQDSQIQIKKRPLII